MSTSPSIRDIAEKLGLGKSTVQRALGGSAEISKTTADLVRRTAAELGYRRDAYFAALSAHRRTAGQTGLPVHFLWGSPRSKLNAGYDSYEALSREGQELGLDVRRVDLRSFPDWRSMLRTLYNRGSRGLLVERVDPVMHDMLRKYDRLPVVCCERQEGLGFHTVRHAIADRVRLCWDKLRAAGYRRIGFVFFRHTPLLNDDRDRLGAALALLSEISPDGRVEPLCYDEEDEEENTTQATYAAWLSRWRPEAVIAFSSGTWFWGNNHPHRPKAFVSLHASALSSGIEDIPGACHLEKTFACEAVVQLDRLIRTGETGHPAHPVDIVIPPGWHEGFGIPHALPTSATP